MTIRHGHYLGYVQDGCRCDPCRDAMYVYRKARALDRLRGRQRLVDSVAAVAHARAMEERWGVAAWRVLEAAGIKRSTAVNLLDGRNERMDRAGAERAVTVTLADLDPVAWMDASHLEDVLDQAIDRTGLTRAAISRRCGFTKDRLRIRGDACRVDTYLAVVELLAGLDTPRCDDCGSPPLAGGRWCLRCFQGNADQRSAPSWDPACGTDRGYQRHWRAREKPCEPCKDAHTVRARQRKVAS